MGSSGLRVRSSSRTNSATRTTPPPMNSQAGPSDQPLAGVTRVGTPSAADRASAAAASAALVWAASATRVKP